MTNDNDKESESVITTKEQVQELVRTVPPPHETQALIEVVKKVDPDPYRIRFLRWLCLASFMVVVVIAMVTLYDSRSHAINRAEANAEKAECRSVVSGDLLIAKARGIQAGNDYQVVLGDILVDAIKQAPPENFQREAELLRMATDRLRAASKEIDDAIGREFQILELCKDGVP
jgi:hypothetical protein